MPKRRDDPSDRTTVTPPQIGAAVRALRLRARLSLDRLAGESGISKSVLSQIENDQTNPTIATLWRLCRALGVDLEDVLRSEKTPAGIRLVPAHSTPTLFTQDRQCAISVLSPVDLSGNVEWYAMRFEPGAALVSQPHDLGAWEHLTVIEGAVEVASGPHTQQVQAGETARYRADLAHAIRNPSPGPAQVFVVVTHQTNGSAPAH